MSFEDIKQLVNGTGEKLIFIEGGQPSFVVMSFDDYRKIAYPHGVEQKNIFNSIGCETTKQPEFFAGDAIAAGLPMQAEKKQDSPVEVKTISTEEEKRELTLEDLPF